jgi:rifampicin phosphotransferase
MVHLQRILLISLVLVLMVSGGCSVAAVSEPEPVSVVPEKLVLQKQEPDDLYQIIEQIKTNPRGPFRRIRWFCNDGSILAPKPYACREHGGGVQHGERTAAIKHLRQQNYLIANLFADLKPEIFFNHPGWKDELTQILLERFLMEIDDGWIFRQARYYRGAIQDEEEHGYGRSLLLGLLKQSLESDRDFLLLREAVRFIPHGLTSDALTSMREQAQNIAVDDPEFSRLRNKLHNQPHADDVQTIRKYTDSIAEEKRSAYMELATLVARVTSPPTDLFSRAAALQLVSEKEAEMIQEDQFGLAMIVQMLVEIRSAMETVHPERKLRLLDLSLQLEAELYRRLNLVQGLSVKQSRRQQLTLIAVAVDGLFGTGMLSSRERQSMKNAVDRLLIPSLTLDTYQREIAYLSRVSRWVENRLRYHFGATIDWLSPLDPAFADYIPERLRGSPLLSVTQMMDRLLSDSQQLAGIERKLFGQTVVGLDALNPGVARGRLEIVNDPLTHSYVSDGIYLLPETLESLPPVAGILTLGEGNALSHIQLLARNLGIPNVAISAERARDLNAHNGKIVVLSANSSGAVRVDEDSFSWRRWFKQQQKRPQILIAPDLDKLDLQQRQILSLDQIKADDSGRIAGPKGANLGELRQSFPELVPDALVIPFGRFYQVLTQTKVEAGDSLFAWMKKNYRQLERLKTEKEREQQTIEFLRRLREYIYNAPLPQSFVSELKKTLQRRFGSEGSYGVFVRSDTNVEDLPGFTGAGLNKTVPHVVGFDNIVTAIRKVWASPFSLRAYSWRQAHMRQPEHVYASVLLMLSVPADKSGVLVTTDLVGGDSTQLHVAVNEGVGGAVSGQRAEEILIDKQNGQVRLLAQASSANRRILLSEGGIKKVAALAPQNLLTNTEITQIRQMSTDLPARFPSLYDSSGALTPVDIEFGFLDGQFILFQIRPLVESTRVKTDLYLAGLNIISATIFGQTVDLDQPPSEINR